MKVPYKSTQLQGISDLTVLARVEPGFVPGAFNTVTYADRLTRVLKVLNAFRQISREASLQPSPISDSIGRFRIIHFFRFAVVPAGNASDGHQLLLNVTFDGGWESYMRTIWGPLGVLLDLIFCHCVDYPMASRCTFDEYMRWVRRNEVVGGFFYVDSAATVGDAAYLRQLDELLRSDGDRSDADTRARGLALPERPPNTIPSALAVTTSLRVLKALDALRDLFPTEFKGAQADAAATQNVLLRFTQDLLRDLRSWIAQGLFDPGQTFDQLSASFEAERRWLMSPIGRPAEKSERLSFSPSDVQAGIAERYPAGLQHGVLVLLRVHEPKTAKQWLSYAPVTSGDKASADVICRNLALTYTGLARLGVPQSRLDGLPREFIEGMEARAGILGDIRQNHPQQWRRPRRNWPWQKAGQRPVEPPIELSTVHVLVQLRTALAVGEDDTDGSVPLSRLAAEIDSLADTAKTGLQVLFVQPMKLGVPPPGAASSRNLFGFVDGISQPSLTAPASPPSYWNDQVKRGELFLGYANGRGDHPDSDPDPLLDNGSYLVVRKLRLYPERLDNALDEAAKRLKPDARDAARSMLREDIKAKIVGRRTDGTPLVKGPGSGNNDFDFRSDGNGAQCPFQSHIRRANPRDPQQPPPRIVRRGMSYGPPASDAADEPRGVVFMAYNSSIAEQFEVIQRWLTGGNSSGLSSGQSDPMLGLSESGRRRVYSFAHEDRVMRVDLGDKPLVELEWGLYAFVPSMATLRNIAAIAVGSRAEPPRGPPLPSPLPGDREAWRLLLEDDNVRAATWEAVRRDHGGLLEAEGYGLLAGSAAGVLEVLKDSGANFSVKGYGERMASSIGHGFLGMDDVGKQAGHQQLAPDVNAAIEAAVSSEQAFYAARDHAQRYLSGLVDGTRALTGASEASVDIVAFGRAVLARLCAEWFGLPDEVLMKFGTKSDDKANDGVARCPGHLLTVSRYVFTPHPLEPVEIPAKQHGELVLKAVKNLLEEIRSKSRKPTDLVERIVSAIALRGDVDLQARTVAGVMLGFPPTVLGNLVSVLIAWSGGIQLWELQQNFAVPGNVDWEQGDKVLRAPFLQTMSEAPVPYAIWRTAVTDKPLGYSTSKGGSPVVVVGLGSAVKDSGDPMLMFGGARIGPDKTTHACPGYAMAIGVMLGTVAALLSAGALRRTSDPRVLALTAAPPPAPRTGATGAAEGAPSAHGANASPWQQTAA